MMNTDADGKSARAQNFLTAGMPWKLIRSKTAVVDRHISPEHIKLYPTNRCNASCHFCSFRDRAKSEELPTGELLEVVRHFHSLGTRAITLAGGGEPTLHPGLGQVLELCRDLGIQVGMITNGLAWSRTRERHWGNELLVWARMSVVDPESGKYDVEQIRRFAENLPDVTVSVYFTVTPQASLDTARAIAVLAETLPNLSHVKFAEEASYGAREKMREIDSEIASKFTKSLLQRRENLPRGAAICHLSLLKPVIGADGYVYPCCNMHPEETHGIPSDFRMGHWRDFRREMVPFSGAKCKSCPWDAYNATLAKLVAPLEHEQFL